MSTDSTSSWFIFLKGKKGRSGKVDLRGSDAIKDKNSHSLIPCLASPTVIGWILELCTLHSLNSLVGAFKVTELSGRFRWHLQKCWHPRPQVE